MKQSGDGIRGPSTTPRGGTIEVEVGAGTTTVYVGTVGSPTKTTVPVGPDRKARIPTSPFPEGTLVIISTGIAGSDVGVIIVEITNNE